MSKINQRSGLFDLKDMKGEITLNFDAQLIAIKDPLPRVKRSISRVIYNADPSPTESANIR
ncbi:hypothetical protein [Lysinibacillus agricola]|uniref:hypothetical protein n=1 Tax=Lysinibacillus agricola TaxID=2590012 RepID=UPI003C21272B